MEVEQVVVEEFEKKYKHFVLNIPRLVFRRGINLVVGPNGSGKSTLLKSIAGFVKPSRGAIHAIIGGKKVPTWSILRWIGYVGEDVILPNMRVESILTEFLGHEKAHYIARELGLTRHLHKKYLELSAGYRRRVQLAIALGKDSSILLLDEPFANLDMFMVEPLKKILENLKDKIVIVTSHHVFNLKFSTLTLLDQGRLVYHGEHRGESMEVLVDILGEECILDLDLLNELTGPIKVRKLITVQEKILELLQNQK